MNEATRAEVQNETIARIKAAKPAKAKPAKAKPAKAKPATLASSASRADNDRRTMEGRTPVLVEGASKRRKFAERPAAGLYGNKGVFFRVPARLFRAYMMHVKPAEVGQALRAHMARVTGWRDDSEDE